LTSSLEGSPQVSPHNMDFVSSPLAPAASLLAGSLSTAATPSLDVSPPMAPQHPIQTRCQTGSLNPKSFPNYQLFYSTKHPIRALHLVLTVFEPTCFIQASKSPEWNKAMLVEYEALLANNTWTLCPIPPHRWINGNKWVFKQKRNPDGSIERYKARLVAKSFDQQRGVDYTETFSPIIKPATVRVLFTLVVQFQWPMQQLDISNAFLHGHLQEEVFMDHPQGFIHPDFPNYVC
jgi:hypothetical protein